MTAIANLVKELQTLLQSAAQAKQDQWHLIAVSSSGEPVLTSCDLPEGLVSAAQEALKSGKCWMVAFRGTLLPLSGKPEIGVLSATLPDGTPLHILRPETAPPTAGGLRLINAAEPKLVRPTGEVVV